MGPLNSTAKLLWRGASLLLVLGLLESCTSARYVLPPVQVSDVRNICRLVGDPQKSGLLGTDLGVSFSGPAPDTINFFFGDTVPAVRGRHADSDDAVAFTRADANPENCLELVFYTDPAGDYVPLELTGFDLGSFDVPTSGFVANGTTFATFATNATGAPRRPTRSVLAVGEQFPQSTRFDYVADLPPDKMTNVSTVLVDDTWRPSPTPTRVLFFGTGWYRAASNVFLAAFPLTTVRSGVRLWFAGRQDSSGPQWSTAEQDAHPLFDHDGAPCMGELSVSWNRYLDRWLMLYNCSSPRGVLFRVAPQPWGPWSAPRVLFDPRSAGGYCVFIHDAHPERDCPPGSPNPGDALILRDQGGANAYGGEYGPYVIDAFTRGDSSGRTTIYFTLSTWNPYQVVLMKASLTR
jgi:uncharacterized protein DUF4185